MEPQLCFAYNCIKSMFWRRQEIIQHFNFWRGHFVLLVAGRNRRVQKPEVNPESRAHPGCSGCDVRDVWGSGALRLISRCGGQNLIKLVSFENLSSVLKDY